MYSNTHWGKIRVEPFFVAGVIRSANIDKDFVDWIWSLINKNIDVLYLLFIELVNVYSVKTSS